MIFITGGAYEGKRRFAKDHFGLREEDIADGRYVQTLPENIICIDNYHYCIKALMETGADPVRLTEDISAQIVIMDEIGCGIIPLDKQERRWREQTGICGCILAQRAQTVVRMICGVPQVIKGAL